MIKIILLPILFLFSAQNLFAQNQTDTLFVTGKVKNEKAISTKLAFRGFTIAEVVVNSHL